MKISQVALSAAGGFDVEDVLIVLQLSSGTEHTIKSIKKGEEGEVQ